MNLAIVHGHVIGLSAVLSCDVDIRSISGHMALTRMVASATWGVRTKGQFSAGLARLGPE